jgi:hypothetical protein
MPINNLLTPEKYCLIYFKKGLNRRRKAPPKRTWDKGGRRRGGARKARLPLIVQAVARPRRIGTN